MNPALVRLVLPEGQPFNLNPSFHTTYKIAVARNLRGGNVRHRLGSQKNGSVKFTP